MNEQLGCSRVLFSLKPRTAYSVRRMGGGILVEGRLNMAVMVASPKACTMGYYLSVERIHGEIPFGVKGVAGYISEPTDTIPCCSRFFGRHMTNDRSKSLLLDSVGYIQGYSRQSGSMDTCRLWRPFY